MAGGIVLHFETSRHPALYAPMSMIILYILFSYTPSLALVPLVIIYLAAQILNKKMPSGRRILPVILFILVAAELVHSLLIRRDLQIGNHYPGGLTALARDIGTTLTNFGFHTLPYAFASPIFTGILIGIVVLPLIGIFGTVPLLISVWALITLCIVIASKGFSYYALEFRIHRLLVVIPILYTSAVWVLRSYGKQLRYRTLALLTAGILFSGFFYYQIFQTNRPVNTQYPFILWLSDQLNGPDESVWLLYHSVDYYNLASVNDTVQYFKPKMTVQIDWKNDFSQEHCSYPETPGIIIIPSESPCLQNSVFSTQPDSTLSSVGNFSFENGETLKAYRYSLH
jgi:hypothetical protein